MFLVTKHAPALRCSSKGMLADLFKVMEIHLEYAVPCNGVCSALDICHQFIPTLLFSTVFHGLRFPVQVLLNFFEDGTFSSMFVHSSYGLQLILGSKVKQKWFHSKVTGKSQYKFFFLLYFNFFRQLELELWGHCFFICICVFPCVFFQSTNFELNSCHSFIQK